MERNDIHAKIDEWIASEMAGGLSGEEKLSLSHHLEECSECRAFYREAKGVSALAGEALSSDRPGPDFENRMVDAFRRNVEANQAPPEARPRAGPGSVLFNLGKIAALLLVLIGAGVLLVPSMYQSGETPEGRSSDSIWTAFSKPEIRFGKAKEMDFECDDDEEEAAESIRKEITYLEAEHQDRLRELVSAGEALRRARVASQKRNGLTGDESGKALDFFGREKLKVLTVVPDGEVQPKAPVAGATVAKPGSAPSPSGPSTPGFRNARAEAKRMSGRRTTASKEKYGFSGYRPVESPGTEAYDEVVDNPFKRVSVDPRSTFSIDVDTASYANVRRFLNAGRFPPKGAVRIEEMVNYFRYDYPGPVGSDPFAVHLEVARCPWNLEHRLVRVGIKGVEIAREERPPSNLVFLIDVSGSMRPNNKLPLLKKGMKLLVNQLTEDDHVGIVVYAGAARVVLSSTPCGRKDRILSAIDGLQAGGSTNGGAGIHMAYEEASRFFVKGGVNRVMLATDGDFNVGVTNRSDLVGVIQEKARSGIFLTVLGFGMGNYKDASLEAIADKGNGNYAYIDNEKEARKVLVEQMTGTLVTIAKDVKIQIEFNPVTVHAWRLVGYENRVLAHRDFNDDRKDAGEIGAGHTVTALYEIVPAGVELREPGVDPLKYEAPESRPSPEAYSGELLNLKLRYKEPAGDTSKLIEFAVMDSTLLYSQASPDFRFASLVAAFGMLLLDSPHRGKVSYAGIAETASDCLGSDPGGRRSEFVNLVRKAQALAGQ